MPIQSKFREDMVRLKTARFIIRFWFKSPADVVKREKDRPAILSGFKSRIEDRNILTTEAVIELADAFFDEHDGIAAIEVLGAAFLSGTVSYYDWP
jgi:hypothetical protein